MSTQLDTLAASMHAQLLRSEIIAARTTLQLTLSHLEQAAALARTGTATEDDIAAIDRAIHDTRHAHASLSPANN